MATKKHWEKRVSSKEAAIALIGERFAAMDNGSLTIDCTVKIKKSPKLFVVPPIPEQALEVGMLVAVHHNPANAAKVIAINGSSITVQRGHQEPVTVDRARLKPLVPLAV